MHTITTEGVQGAQARLTRTAERASHQRATLETEAKRVQRQITGIPRASGRLEKGVKGGSESVITVTDSSYAIGTKVPYARFVFRGTSTMPARPPRIPPNTGQRAAQAVNADLRHA